MRDRRQSPLSGSQVQLAKRYETLLDTINNEFPEPFKFREVTGRFDDIGHGDLLKLKNAGLVDNEYGDPDSPKDWYLTMRTKRWLRTR